MRAPRTPDTDAERLAKARELADQHGQGLDQLRGRRIRVVRAVVYEGEAEAVFLQLARSLAPGPHPGLGVAGSGDRQTMSVTVVQDQTEQLVDDVDLRDLLAWQHELAKLPPEITVAAFGLCGIGGCPSLQLMVNDVGVAAVRDAQVDGRGDARYTVRAGTLSVLRDGTPFVISEAGSPTINVSVTHEDPRGPVGGMVAEIGRAASELARPAVGEEPA